MDIRVLDRNGEPWFVAQDVLYALGYPQTSHGKALAKLDPDERFMSQVHKGVRSMTLVSESGLYSLILNSKKPDAKTFKKWVTWVVLPAIRKDGAYVMGEEKVATDRMSEDELIAKGFMALHAKAERLQAKVLKLNQTVAEQAHAVGLPCT
jgi:prophage antirepressor-like protein